MNNFNPFSEGYQNQVLALDNFIEQSLDGRDTQDLIRLNTYLRRYLSPLVTRDLFLQKRLPCLLQEQEVRIITALILDIRGYVQTTQAEEYAHKGLSSVAQLLKDFFGNIIGIAFENRGLVGEFAGDQVLITFGFPPPIMEHSETQNFETFPIINVQRAFNTAFRIHDMIKSDQDSFKGLEVGIGICTGGPAWFGDIGDNSDNFWRQELTVISNTVNIASRAEELTKEKEIIHADVGKRIIADKNSVEVIQQIAENNHYAIRIHPLESRPLKGIDKEVNLFHILDLESDIFPERTLVKNDDRQLVHWICEHVDGAIERNTFHQIYSSFNKVGQVLSSSTTQDEKIVFEQIMERVIESFGAEKATLYKIDPLTEDLLVMSSKGTNPLLVGTRLDRMTGIAGRIAREGREFLSADVHTERLWAGQEKFSKYDPNIHSMMCVPLISGDQIVGVIQIMDKSIGKFREIDLKTLVLFAGLATVALENTRLYEQDKRITRARLIITKAFSNATTLDEVLDAVMRAVQDVLRARNATLYKIDRERDGLIFQKVISESETAPAEETFLPRGKGIVSRVVAKKKSLLIIDTQKEKDWFDKIGSDIRSMICVPLIARGQTVGAIQVLDKKPGVFNQDHLEILEWLAISAATAIANAGRIEQANRKLIASESIAGMAGIAGKLAHNLKNYVTGIRSIATYDMKKAIVHDITQYLQGSKDITQFNAELIENSARFKLTEESLEDLEDEDLPENILKGLEPLKNQEIEGEETFLSEVKKHVGEEQALLYKSLLVEYAEILNTKKLLNEIVETADLALEDVQRFMEPLTDWKAENVDMNTMLSEVVAKVGKDLGEKQEMKVLKSPIDITYRPLSESEPVVYAAKEQLKYIFRNLIDNAVRAIGRKKQVRGEIILKTTIESLNEVKWVVTTVQDTGEGIPEENLKRLFKRSFTTRPEGTIGGYGLFWVSLNIALIGGKIEATNIIGKGAMFTIRLPVSTITTQ